MTDQNQATEEERKLYVKHLDRYQRLKQWMGLVAGNHLKWESERQQRMISAEDEAGAKAMGWKLPTAGGLFSKAKKMAGDTILGDVHYEQKGSALGKLALVAATIAGIGTTGVLGLGVLKAPEIIEALKGDVVVPEDTDTLTDVTPGFGVPEDVE